ncbi:hypothetical protein TRFO_32339 [Tritrichomonas foetus]|uniref:Tetraspanin family protein n=1 Tax=Tritrichomonas foetus TaxID=1144522 RepID=A0A1J4JUD5_9EUKA|nr:hypothetical protein TRFO_32339 [Tritrichomonas foetus]|eukprot:OHT00869.1 hypothetical protein TRFO_32339 [Tritrichomonas foetus]
MPKSSKSKGIIIFTIFTISAATLTIMGLYYIFEVFDKRDISGVNLSFDKFIRASCILIIITEIFVFASICLKYKYVRFVSLIFIGCFICFDIFVIYECIAKRSSIINGFEYVFFTDNYEKKAHEIQKSSHCCGWENISEAVEYTDCTYVIPCKISLTNYLKKKSISFIILFILALISNCLSFYGEIVMIQTLFDLSNKYKEVPQNDPVGDPPRYAI